MNQELDPLLMHTAASYIKCFLFLLQYIEVLLLKYLCHPLSLNYRNADNADKCFDNTLVLALMKLQKLQLIGKEGF